MAQVKFPPKSTALTTTDFLANDVVQLVFFADLH